MVEPGTGADTSPLQDEPPPGETAEHPLHVRVRDLVKRFGTFLALDHVSLDVGRGQLVCLLGPSGCGKTTLLRAIAGLERQSEGRIEIGGRNVSNAPPTARDFGIVFQSYALFPNLTAAANIGYGLVNRGIVGEAITARIDELAALVGIGDQLAKYPAQLSGGQQQRVALARALATKPSLLLLDEPLSALDARVRVRLRQEIKSLQRRLGVTTIMVTHDQEEALSMADRVIVMNQGRIEQEGTPADIYTRPTSEFVADFVGSMNVIDADLRRDGMADAGWLVLETDGGLQPGRVRLAARPEAIRLQPAADATNRFAAEVAATDYFGAFLRVTIVPLSAPDVRLIADVGADTARQLGLRPGIRIEAAIPREAISVFPEARRHCA